jgi:hypothetical protein
MCFTIVVNTVGHVADDTVDVIIAAAAALVLVIHHFQISYSTLVLVADMISEQHYFAPNDRLYPLI